MILINRSKSKSKRALALSFDPYKIYVSDKAKGDMEQYKCSEVGVRLMSVKEACGRLGIGHWAIYQQINKRALKTVKIGGRRLVSAKALNEFITSLEQ